MIPLNQAEQQLVGFIHAKKGYSLAELIQGMGLTKREWKRMKEIYRLSFLSERDKKEIDEFFNIEN